MIQLSHATINQTYQEYCKQGWRIVNSYRNCGADNGQKFDQGGDVGGGGVLELGQRNDNGMGQLLFLIIVLAKMRIFDLVHIWLELGAMAAAAAAQTFVHIDDGNRAEDDASASSPVPPLPARWRRQRQRGRLTMATRRTTMPRHHHLSLARPHNGGGSAQLRQ